MLEQGKTYYLTSHERVTPFTVVERQTHGKHAWYACRGADGILFKLPEYAASQTSSRDYVTKSYTEALRVLADDKAHELLNVSAQLSRVRYEQALASKELADAVAGRPIAVSKIHPSLIEARDKVAELFKTVPSAGLPTIRHDFFGHEVGPLEYRVEIEVDEAELDLTRKPHDEFTAWICDSGLVTHPDGIQVLLWVLYTEKEEKQGSST